MMIRRYREPNRKKYGILIDSDRAMPAVTIWVHKSMWLWLWKEKYK
jgi:hypothetical protein